jgi:hypothetical protein
LGANLAEIAVVATVLGRMALACTSCPASLQRCPNGKGAGETKRFALDWLFPTCAVEGCGVRSAFLETDRRVDWNDLPG